MTDLTLTLITKDNQILLGLKKRGFGMGKYNGFGGKLEPGRVDLAVENPILPIFLTIPKLDSALLLLLATSSLKPITVRSNCG